MCFSPALDKKILNRVGSSSRRRARRPRRTQPREPRRSGSSPSSRCFRGRFARPCACPSVHFIRRRKSAYPLTRSGIRSRSDFHRRRAPPPLARLHFLRAHASGRSAFARFHAREPFVWTFSGVSDPRWARAVGIEPR